MTKQLEWREHRIGFVADPMYSLCCKRGKKYEVRHNGFLVKLTACSLDEAKAAAQLHYDKNYGS